MFSSHFCWRTFKLSLEKIHLIMLLSLGTFLCVLSCYRTTPLKLFYYESGWTIFIMPKNISSLLENWSHHQNQKKNRAIWRKESPHWYKFIIRQSYYYLNTFFCITTLSIFLILRKNWLWPLFFSNNVYILKRALDKDTLSFGYTLHHENASVNNLWNKRFWVVLGYQAARVTFLISKRRKLDSMSL